MGDGNGEKSQEYLTISVDEDKKKVSNEHSEEWREVDKLLDKYFGNSNKILSPSEVKSLEAVLSESGVTVLDLTVRFGSRNQLTFLLGNDHFKSLVDTPNNDGWTPLHRAIENKKDWAVKALLQHNADPNARNKEGNSPLHHLKSCNLNLSWKCFIKDIVKKQREYDTFLDIDALNYEKKTPRNELEIITGDQLSASSTDGLGPHATKIKQRANIYNLLMKNKYSDLLPKLETKQDVDFYVDNKKLICHILGRLKREKQSEVPALKQIVKKLLELGVTPLSSDNRGRNTAVELALENKQRDLFKQMIYNLRTDEKYDISFDLLRRTFMMTAEVNDFQEREKETMYWLQFLFDNDAIENINQINSRRSTKETALHIAVNYSNERALVFLLKRGAALSEDNSKDLLDTLTPESLTEVMSHAISFEKTEDENKVSVTAVLNYKFLHPHQETGKRKDESGGSNETDIVMNICKQYKDAIAHPLLWTLIMAKWSKLEKANTVYSVITILYNLALVIAFTALVWPISNHGTDPSKSTDERHVLKWTVIVLCLISFVVDVSKFVLSLWPRSLWPQRSIKIVLSLACYDIFVKFLIIISCAGIFSTNFVAWVVPAA